MIIDLHCDTILKLYDNNMTNLSNNSYHIDITKLRKSGTLGQFFAFFINSKKILPFYQNEYEYLEQVYNYFMYILEIHSDDIAIAKSLNDLNENRINNKISAFLTIEGGEGIGDKVDNLNKLYDKGIRLITLLWNYPNKLGYPNTSDEYMSFGLTNFGYEVIEKMNDLGIIIDVSHLSDQGFYNVAEKSTKPFIASHSNARAITPHRRNLSDDMIRVIANKGGVIGINYYSTFLGKGNFTKIDDIIIHIKHIYNKGGIDVLALGSDFDGIDCKIEFDDASGVYRILDRLVTEGFSSNEIDKISYKNICRVLKYI